MVYILEINDTYDQCPNLLSPTLGDFLELIKKFGADLTWSIMYLTAAGDLGPNRSILDFEQEIIDSPCGYLLSWKQLNIVSTKFTYIDDILLVASNSSKNIRQIDNDQALYHAYPIVIELFDSSYWRVATSNNEIINKVKDKFNDVKFINPDTL